MGTLMDCIQAIPDRTQTLMDAIDVTYEALDKALKGNYNKIVIVGSGSSYNAGLFIKSFAEMKLDMSVELFLPNDFVYNTNHKLLSKDSLYVFISQSGMTKLVVEGAQIALDHEFEIVGITENQDSILARMSNASLITLDKKEDYIFRTIGFTTTVILLDQLLLWNYLRNSSDKLGHITYLGQLNTTLKQLNNILSDSVKWFDEHKSTLMEHDAFIFSAALDYWPVAKEADIKFMEMLPMLTNSFELEELVHGPQNMFTSNQGFFILTDQGKDIEKAANVVDFIETEVNAKTYLINKNIFTGDIELNSFTPLLYLMFFQVQSFKIADARGMSMKTGTYPKISEYVARVVAK